MTSTGMTPLGRLVLPLALAVALLLPSSAWADEARVKDATGDVFTEAGVGHDPIPEGSKANTDVRRTVVRHGREDLHLVVRYLELAAGVSDQVGLVAHLRLAESSGLSGLTLLVTVDGDLAQGSVALLEFDGLEHDCPDAAAVAKPGKDRLVVTVPRTCLGSPEWIRFSASAQSLRKGHGKLENYTDDVLAKNPHSSNRTKRLYAG